jgi:hypothetical protein
MSVILFQACSVGGIPGAKKWFFAVQAICGFYQVIVICKKVFVSVKNFMNPLLMLSFDLLVL